MNSSSDENVTAGGEPSTGSTPTMQGGYHDIRIGMKIGPNGRYQIKDALGKGGMGEVYLAVDEVSQTEVAIKLVPREVSLSDDEMEQVRRNFALVRNLHHPNIAAVTGLERLPSGEYILIMEAVPGRRTLQKDRLARDGEKLPVQEAIEICGKIASALDYAHSQKVIHRDVKPGNVLLTPDGQVKLTDFGLAAQIMSSLNRVSVLPTRTSGTRPYMAPEQWEGRLQDEKTDQWALAVVFYELVAGHLPFPADDPAILERQVLEKTPERPVGLSKAQWLVLAKALSKESRGRYMDCTSFITALAKHRAPRPGVGVAVLVIAAVALAAAGWMVLRGRGHAVVAPDQSVSNPTSNLVANAVSNAVADAARERAEKESLQQELEKRQKALEEQQREIESRQKQAEEADKLRARLAAEEAARKREEAARRQEEEARRKAEEALRVEQEVAARTKAATPVVQTQVVTQVVQTYVQQAAPSSPYVSIQSYNYGDRFFGHAWYFGELMPVGFPADREATTFRLVVGLADANGVSFEAKTHSGHYLRTVNNRITLQAWQDSPQFRADATFYRRPGLASADLVSFESSSQPGFYIRHSWFHLVLSQNSDDRAPADCTFRIVEPLAP